MDDTLIPTEKEQQDAIASLPAVRVISENNVVVEIHGIKVPGRILTAVMQGLAEGKTLTFSDPQVEVSTQEAADILKVSRPFVLRLFDKGLIPGRLVGKHRRMLRTDVEEYKRKKAEQLLSMIEYQRLSDELEPGRDKTSADCTSNVRSF
jgi:excisionase family DNA binding protein